MFAVTIRGEGTEVGGVTAEQNSHPLISSSAVHAHMELDALPEQAGETRERLQKGCVNLEAMLQQLREDNAAKVEPPAEPVAMVDVKVGELLSADELATKLENLCADGCTKTGAGGRFR